MTDPFTLITLAVYLALLLGLAWYVSRRQDLETYFLNRRKTGLWLMVLSTVATIMGAGASVAIVAEVYSTGISYGLALPFSLAVAAVVMAIFAKRMKEEGDRYGVYTLPEYLRCRFGRRVGLFASALQSALIIVWIGIQAIALGSLTSIVLDIPYALALGVGGAFTIIYTLLGGLKVDFLSDAIQFFIITIVFVLAAVLGYGRVGGFSFLEILPPGHLDPFAFGGITWLIGIVVLGGFLYMGSSMHWQRIYAVRDPGVARKAYLISIPFFLFLGLVILFIGLVAAGELAVTSPETALFAVMEHLLPPALAGLGLASLLAVVMSSLDSLLIGGATIAYQQFFETKQMRYARLFTALFGVLGFLVALAFPAIVTVSLIVTYAALNFVPAALAALYSKKIGKDAVFTSLLGGTLVLVCVYPFLGSLTFSVSVPAAVLLLFVHAPLGKLFRKLKHAGGMMP